LTEIKIRRISKYNVFKADEKIKNIEEELKQVKHDLAHLVDYSIAYYENLLKKYGKGKERRTVISSFETIKASEVVANNAKLYANFKEGFIGMGMKKDEFICDCSDIDNVIVFRKDGKFKVVKISEKTFVGKNIIHVAVWKKGDDRTTYNMIYTDGKSGKTMVKRFNVTAITRDKDYDLTKGTLASKLHYFTANPNGEAEIVGIQLTPGCRAKKKMFDYDFSELAIKGRGSQGNLLTKYPIRKITLKEAGKSTLNAIKIWMDDVSGRLNTDGRGKLLGEFDTGDHILALYKDGTYLLTDYELSNRYEAKDIVDIKKFDPEMIISAIHYDGEKGMTFVKRFKIEAMTTGKKYSFISEHKSSKLFFASFHPNPIVHYIEKDKSKKIEKEVKVEGFIDVKGWKSQGNKLSGQRITGVKDITPKDVKKDKLSPGDSIDFDLDGGQPKLF